MSSSTESPSREGANTITPSSPHHLAKSTQSLIFLCFVLGGVALFAICVEFSARNDQLQAKILKRTASKESTSAVIYYYGQDSAGVYWLDRMSDPTKKAVVGEEITISRPWIPRTATGSPLGEIEKLAWPLLAAVVLSVFGRMAVTPRWLHTASRNKGSGVQIDPVTVLGVAITFWGGVQLVHAGFAAFQIGCAGLSHASFSGSRVFGMEDELAWDRFARSGFLATAMGLGFGALRGLVQSGTRSRSIRWVRGGLCSGVLVTTVWLVWGEWNTGSVTQPVRDRRNAMIGGSLIAGIDKISVSGTSLATNSLAPEDQNWNSFLVDGPMPADEMVPYLQHLNALGDDLGRGVGTVKAALGLAGPGFVDPEDVIRERLTARLKFPSLGNPGGSPVLKPPDPCIEELGKSLTPEKVAEYDEQLATFDESRTLVQAEVDQLSALLPRMKDAREAAVGCRPWLDGADPPLARLEAHVSGLVNRFVGDDSLDKLLEVQSPESYDRELAKWWDWTEPALLDAELTVRGDDDLNGRFARGIEQIRLCFAADLESRRAGIWFFVEQLANTDELRKEIFLAERADQVSRWECFFERTNSFFSVPANSEKSPTVVKSLVAAITKHNSDVSVADEAIQALRSKNNERMQVPNMSLVRLRAIEQVEVLLRSMEVELAKAPSPHDRRSIPPLGGDVAPKPAWTPDQVKQAVRGFLGLTPGSKWTLLPAKFDPTLGSVDQEIEGKWDNHLMKLLKTNDLARFDPLLTYPKTGKESHLVVAELKGIALTVFGDFYFGLAKAFQARRDGASNLEDWQKDDGPNKQSRGKIMGFYFEHNVAGELNRVIEAAKPLKPTLTFEKINLDPVATAPKATTADERKAAQSEQLSHADEYIDALKDLGKTLSQGQENDARIREIGAFWNLYNKGVEPPSGGYPNPADAYFETRQAAGGNLTKEEFDRAAKDQAITSPDRIKNLATRRERLQEADRLRKVGVSRETAIQLIGGSEQVDEVYQVESQKVESVTPRAGEVPNQ